MKRMFAFTLCTVIFLLLLSGCNSSKENNPLKTDVPTNALIEDDLDNTKKPEQLDLDKSISLFSDNVLNDLPKAISKESREKLLQELNVVFSEKNYGEEAEIQIRSAMEKAMDYYVNFQTLFEAIDEKVCIEFDYMRYNHNKELVKKRDKKYQLHPYYLVYMHDKAYLIGKNEKYNDFSHYRVDKMMHIEKLDKPVMTLENYEDPYEYAKNKVYMYGGNEEKITLKCHNKILDDMIDTFGKEIEITPLGDDYFMTTIVSSKQGILYLAMQYAQYMEIIKPQEIRDELYTLLKETMDKYR